MRPLPPARLAQFAWAVFDGARSPYNVLVNIFVFSAYFSSVVIADGVRGQTMWSFATAAGALLVALTAPLLGAIADAGGRRKPWLVATIIIGVPSMLTLWFATPGMTEGLWVIVLALIGGTIFYEHSAIFLNAMLPNIARPERIGFLSGAGLAMANLFGILLFLFFLFGGAGIRSRCSGWTWLRMNPSAPCGILAAIAILLFGLAAVLPDAGLAEHPAQHARSRAPRRQQPHRHHPQDPALPECRGLSAIADLLLRRLHRADAVHRRVRRGHPALERDDADRAGAHQQRRRGDRGAVRGLARHADRLEEEHHPFRRSVA